MDIVGILLVISVIGNILFVCMKKIKYIRSPCLQIGLRTPRPEDVENPSLSVMDTKMKPVAMWAKTPQLNRRKTL